MTDDARDRWLTRQFAETCEPIADEPFVRQVMASVRRRARRDAAVDLVWHALISVGVLSAAWTALPLLADVLVATQAAVATTPTSVMAVVLALVVALLVLVDYADNR